MRYIILLLAWVFSVYSLQGQEVELLPQKNQGIFNVTEAGYLPGVGNISRDGALEVNESQTYRIRTVFGYFVSPRFSVGLGAGLDGYNNPDYNTLPVFVDVRGYLYDSRNTPYVFLDLGKSLKPDDTFEQGLYLNLGAGYKFFISDYLCMEASVGYNYQRMKPEMLYVDESFDIGFNLKTPTNLKALSIQVGLLFQLWQFEEPEEGLTPR
jgi:hypothetical protein